jgi:hypothetical protein
MSSPPWLVKYYGPKWMEQLHPTIAIDGKNFAIVRVAFPRSQAHVLVRKTGTMIASTHEIVCEGVLKKGDLERMKERLAAVDRK